MMGAMISASQDTLNEEATLFGYNSSTGRLPNSGVLLGSEGSGPWNSRTSTSFVQNENYVYEVCPTQRIGYRRARRVDNAGSIEYYADDTGDVELDDWTMVASPGGTNVQYRAYWLGHSAWSAVNMSTSYLNAVGLDGVTNHATTIKSLVTTSAGYITDSLGSASAYGTARFHIKKDTDESRFPLCQNGWDSGYRQGVFLNTKTGAYIERSDATNGSFEVWDDGDDWVVIIRQNKSSFSKVGARIHPAAADTLDGNIDVTSTGQLVVRLIEMFYDTPIEVVRAIPPIIANLSATTSVDADEITQLASNISATRGMVVMEFWSMGESGALDEILTLSASGANMLAIESDLIKSADGTNTASRTYPTDSNTMHRIGVAYDVIAGKMAVVVDGTAGTITNFDGSYNPTTNLSWARSMSYGQRVRNVRHFHGGTFWQLLAKAEDLTV